MVIYIQGLIHYLGDAANMEYQCSVGSQATLNFLATCLYLWLYFLQSNFSSLKGGYIELLAKGLGCQIIANWYKTSLYQQRMRYIQSKQLKAASSTQLQGSAALCCMQLIFCSTIMGLQYEHLSRLQKKLGSDPSAVGSWSPILGGFIFFSLHCKFKTFMPLGLL